MFQGYHLNYMCQCVISRRNSNIPVHIYSRSFLYIKQYNFTKPNTGIQSVTYTDQYADATTAAADNDDEDDDEYDDDDDHDDAAGIATAADDDYDDVTVVPSLRHLRTCIISIITWCLCVIQRGRFLQSMVQYYTKEL